MIFSCTASIRVYSLITYNSFNHFTSTKREWDARHVPARCLGETEKGSFLRISSSKHSTDLHCFPSRIKTLVVRWLAWMSRWKRLQLTNIKPATYERQYSQNCARCNYRDTTSVWLEMMFCKVASFLTSGIFKKRCRSSCTKLNDKCNGFQS